MRGGTCVQAEFPNRKQFTDREPMYPVFQREHMRSGPAPMKQIVRREPAKIIRWW